MWDDPQGALQKYLTEKDYLHAGKTPPRNREGLTVRDMANQFLTERKGRVEIGELTNRSWRDYHRTCDRMIDVLGRDRLVDDLRPDDFGKLRKVFAKTMGPAALSAEIARVRVIFNFAYQNELIDKPPRYGTAFDRPPKRLLRQSRNGNGPRMFDRDEIHAMLEAASTPLRAMILLGINGGMGPADLGRMPMGVLDLEAGFVNYPRPKTGIPRRFPLWPETVQALRDYLAGRPKPKRPELAERVFLTSTGGPWFVDAVDGPITAAMRRLLRRTGLYHRGRGFYGLRRSFRTVADATKDQPACDCIMGHADTSMAGVYRQGVEDERLKAVADHVHGWLFGSETKE